MMRHRQRRSAVIIALALGLTGCASANGGKPKQTEGAEAGSAGTPTMTVAMVTHAAPGDTFWDLVRKGAEAAAKKDNINLEYSSDPDAAKQASLIQAAVDKKVDGIAVTLAKPDALATSITAANTASIPVTGLNSGVSAATKFGLKGFFGQDEAIAGQAAGDRLAAAGAKNVVCVIQEQGNVALEERCKGVKDKIPSTQILYVTGTDMSSVQSSMTSKLQQDKTIDWMITLGAPFAMTAVKSAKSAGSSAKVGTFDTNAELVKAIQSGDVQWAVDQQPYLQGYLAVDSLWLYKFNANTIGGGQPTLTGPAFVDKTNVDAVAKFAEAGTR